jgi:hypothetical protein
MTHTGRFQGGPKALLTRAKAHDVDVENIAQGTTGVVDGLPVEAERLRLAELSPRRHNVRP